MDSPVSTAASISRYAAWWAQRVEIQLRESGYTPPDKGILTLPKFQLRLLNWRVWTIRYGVSLAWLAEKIVKKYSRRTIKGLSLHLRMTTGPKAQKYIESQVVEEFPRGENIQAQKAELRMRILGSPLIHIQGTDNPDKMAQRYQVAAAKKREQFTHPKGFRRPWRGNPWL